jgi:predicted transposase YbfD/YdcC
VILIAGIGCEILTAYKTSDWSGQIIGGIEARVGEAEQRAAEANLKAAQTNERASQNEKEAEKLRKQAQPRKIREADRQNLGKN